MPFIAFLVEITRTKGCGKTQNFAEQNYKSAKCASHKRCDARTYFWVEKSNRTYSVTPASKSVRDDKGSVVGSVVSRRSRSWSVSSESIFILDDVRMCSFAWNGQVKLGSAWESGVGTESIVVLPNVTELAQVSCSVAKVGFCLEVKSARLQ